MLSCGLPTIFKTRKKVVCKDDLFFKDKTKMSSKLTKTHSLADRLNLMEDFTGRSYTLFCKMQEQQKEAKLTLNTVSKQIHHIIESTTDQETKSKTVEFVLKDQLSLTMESSLDTCSIAMGDMYTKYTYTQFSNYIDLIEVEAGHGGKKIEFESDG